MVLNPNPIPEILDLISSSGGILGLLVTDEMRLIIHKHTNNIVNNSYIILLLTHLRDAGVVSIEELSWPDTTGKILLIKRN